MSSMSPTFIYIAAFFILVVFISYVYYRHFRYNRPDTSPEDTIYFKVIDDDGNESCTHDSGYKPSQLSPNTTITLQILKTEYNDGKANKIGLPKTIIIGKHPQNLHHTIHLTPKAVKDYPLYHEATVSLKSF